MMKLWQSHIFRVNGGRGSSFRSIVAHVIEGLHGGWEGIVVSEVQEVVQGFFLMDFREQELPWFPALHYSDEFQLVVGLVDQLFDQTCSYLLLNSTD